MVTIPLLATMSLCFNSNASAASGGQYPEKLNQDMPSMPKMIHESLLGAEKIKPQFVNFNPLFDDENIVESGFAGDFLGEGPKMKGDIVVGGILGTPGIGVHGYTKVHGDIHIYPGGIIFGAEPGTVLDFSDRTGRATEHRLVFHSTLGTPSLSELQKVSERHDQSESLLKRQHFFPGKVGERREKAYYDEPSAVASDIVNIFNEGFAVPLMRLCELLHVNPHQMPNPGNIHFLLPDFLMGKNGYIDKIPSVGGDLMGPDVRETGVSEERPGFVGKQRGLRGDVLIKNGDRKILLSDVLRICMPWGVISEKLSLETNPWVSGPVKSVGGKSDLADKHAFKAKTPYMNSIIPEKYLGSTAKEALKGLVKIEAGTESVFKLNENDILITFNNKVAGGDLRGIKTGSYQPAVIANTSDQPAELKCRLLPLGPLSIIGDVVLKPDLSFVNGTDRIVRFWKQHYHSVRGWDAQARAAALSKNSGGDDRMEFQMFDLPSIMDNPVMAGIASSALFIGSGPKNVGNSIDLIKFPGSPDFDSGSSSLMIPTNISIPDPKYFPSMKTLVWSGTLTLSGGEYIAHHFIKVNRDPRAHARVVIDRSAHFITARDARLDLIDQFSHFDGNWPNKDEK